MTELSKCIICCVCVRTENLLTGLCRVLCAWCFWMWIDLDLCLLAIHFLFMLVSLLFRLSFFSPFGLLVKGVVHIGLQLNTVLPSADWFKLADVNFLVPWWIFLSFPTASKVQVFGCSSSTESLRGLHRPPIGVFSHSYGLWGFSTLGDRDGLLGRSLGSCEP